jgi:Skp family chaperone for outer membrane proteins
MLIVIRSALPLIPALLVLLSLLPSLSTGQEARLGVCDFQRLISSNPRYLEFQKEQLERRRALRETEKDLLARIRSLREESEQLKQQRQAGPPDETLEDRIFELTQQGIILDREVHDRERQYEKEMVERISECRKEVHGELQEEVDQFARENQFNLIIDSSGTSRSGFPFVLHHHGRLDLTPALLGHTEVPEGLDSDPPVVAVINTQQLFDLHPATKNITKQLEEARNELEEEDAARKARLKRGIELVRREIVKRNSPPEEGRPTGLDPRQERRAVKILERERLELEGWRIRMRQSLKEIQQVEYDKVKTMILAEIRDFAQTQSYDLLLDQAAMRLGGTLILPGSLDSKNITQEVRDHFDQLRTDQDQSATTPPADGSE